MVNKRNRVLKLVNYLESLGIEVNIGKNKAQGKNGFLKIHNNKYRIDVAKGLDEDSTIKTLSHEFAHFLHYQYDKNLINLDFIFPTSEDITEELISITVEKIQKNSIKPLFIKKEELLNEIKICTEKIKKQYPDFKSNMDYKILEEKIKKTHFKHLLKYDRIKLIDTFSFKIYDIDSLIGNSIEEQYLILKSKKRALKRLQTKISKMNNYYNRPTELFARSFEAYFFEKELLKAKAPNVFYSYENFINEKVFFNLEKFIKIINL